MQRVNGGTFVDGDPTTGTVGTRVMAGWLNAVQEELATIVEASGADLDSEDNGQVLVAINGMFGFQSGIVMLFGQSSAPNGWTKKSDWSDNSMLIFTTGDVASGGSMDPKSWATGVAVADHDDHYHTTSDLSLTTAQIPAHTHTINGGTAGGTATQFLFASNVSGSAETSGSGGGEPHNHGATSGQVGSSKSHSITQSMFTPKYQSVIAATKD